MDFKFSYLPVTGPLSGKSFEEQTAKAINEAGQIACDAQHLSEEASAGTKLAQKEAGNALEKANEAFSTANRALDAARTAGQTANAAVNSAREAQAGADEAFSHADKATEKAVQAQASANQALENGEKAMVIATANSTRINLVNAMAELARDTSEQALSVARTSLYYKPANEANDLDLMLDSASFYIDNTRCAHLPVPEKGFLSIRTDEDDTRILQTYKTQDNRVYTRTGTISVSSSINAGLDTISLSYQSSETHTYELDIQSNGDGTHLSVSRFTGASHSLAETDEAALTGHFIFEQDAFNDGSLTVNGMALADVSAGNITLTHNQIVTEHGVVSANDAELNNNSLNLTLSFTWKDTATIGTGVFTGWNQLATQASVDTKQDTLTFDAVPTAGSMNPVTSSGIKTAIDSAISTVYKWKGSVDSVAGLPASGNAIGDVYNVVASGANYGWTGQAWDNLGGIEAVDPLPASASSLPVASGGVFDALASKQDNLTFDESPTTDSDNPVTSSGIKAAIDVAVTPSPEPGNIISRQENGLFAQVPVFNNNTDGLVPHPDGLSCRPDAFLTADGNWLRLNTGDVITSRTNDAGMVFVPNVAVGTLTLETYAASATTFGLVKPDNMTITADKGVISAVAPDLSTYATQKWVREKDFLTRDELDSRLGNLDSILEDILS